MFEAEAVGLRAKPYLFDSGMANDEQVSARRDEDLLAGVPHPPIAIGVLPNQGAPISARAANRCS
jgi:hypothetical protein